MKVFRSISVKEHVYKRFMVWKRTMNFHDNTEALATLLLYYDYVKNNPIVRAGSGRTL